MKLRLENCVTFPERTRSDKSAEPTVALKWNMDDKKTHVHVRYRETRGGWFEVAGCCTMNLEHTAAIKGVSRSPHVLNALNIDVVGLLGV